MADSKLEVHFQHAMRQLGWDGFEANNKDIPGKPDLAWPYHTPPIAIFVDGCFWHGCPQHVRIPRKRGKSWKLKLFKIKRNDRGLGYPCLHCGEPTGYLPEQGWIVVRVWEHDIKQCPLEAAKKVVEEIKRQANLRGFSIRYTFGGGPDLTGT